MPKATRLNRRDALRGLRGGFVLRPGLIAMALAAAAVTLAAAEQRIATVKAWSDLLDRIFPPEPEAARIVLGTIAGSMITVVSVVYSILLVALTFTSAQFSPRVLVAFVEDRVSQTTLGIFVGTFAYCLLTLPAVRGGPAPFVPSIAVVGAMGLAIACMACLLYFIHHIAESIQAGHIVDRIARETEWALDQLFTIAPEDAARGDEPAMVRPGLPVFSAACGYIRTVDEEGLLATARAHRVAIRVDRSIGQFISEGALLLEVGGSGPVSADLEAACRQAFEIGPVRTMEQDVEFGVLQIVDIALKAISPAVNDPTTATTCLDQLGRILLRASLRWPVGPTLRDPEGMVRLVVQRTSFPRLLDVAFSQIRHYGKADVAVPLRMMRILGELAAASGHAPHAAVILEQARRLAAACERGFPEDDRAELDDRLAVVERRAEAVLAPEPRLGPEPGASGTGGG